MNNDSFDAKGTQRNIMERNGKCNIQIIDKRRGKIVKYSCR